MSIEWLVYGWIFGIIICLGGMAIGNGVRPLVGKPKAPITWKEAGWCVVYASVIALQWGWAGR